MILCGRKEVKPTIPKGNGRPVMKEVAAKNMDVIIGSAVFLAGVITSVVLDIVLLAPLSLGFLCYAAIARVRGFGRLEVAKMSAEGAKESLLVVLSLLAIGAVSASWRACGTIAIFVHYGLALITPHLFLLIAFLLCCVFSYALGTCFGTAGTIGIILVAIAEAGDVSVPMTAGAILSGGYFGDRFSPTSASANLTAFVTKTDLYDNIEAMVKTTGLPFLLTAGIYGGLSYVNPLQTVDLAMDAQMQQGFELHPVLLLPAAVMLLLPLFKVDMKIAALISAAAASAIAVVLQGMAPEEMLLSLLMGYAPADAGLAELLAGGGLISMAKVCGIVFIACSYSKIINETGMFMDLVRGISKACGRIGTTQMTFLTGTILSGTFCTCTAAIIMSDVLLEDAYRETGADRRDLAVDIGNTVELTATWVPWCTACVATFSALAVSGDAILYGFYVFILPIYYMLTKYIKERKNGRNSRLAAA